LFISHKFDEIFELADYYTILRDGVFVSSGAINDIITEERMVAMMVGRASPKPTRKSTARRAKRCWR
jgi:rhamnose transport system ATP-binding protein